MKFTKSDNSLIPMLQVGRSEEKTRIELPRRKVSFELDNQDVELLQTILTSDKVLEVALFIKSLPKEQQEAVVRGLSL